MSQVAYEVTVSLAAEDDGEEFARFMRAEHIPAVLQTGCFQSAEFGRLDGTTFRTRYVASSDSQLQHYLDKHTARLRDHFAASFGTRASATRENWELIQLWEWNKG